MGFFDDMTTAVMQYPATSVEIEVVDLDYPGAGLNSHEEGTFRVQVTNAGALNMLDVKLHIKGLNGTTVKPAGDDADYVTEFITDPSEIATVGAHGNVQKTNVAYGFKAPGPHAKEDLILAWLSDWNGDQSHILVDHAAGDTNVQGKFTHQVLAA